MVSLSFWTTHPRVWGFANQKFGYQQDAKAAVDHSRQLRVTTHGHHPRPLTLPRISDKKPCNNKFSTMKFVPEDLKL